MILNTGLRRFTGGRGSLFSRAGFDLLLNDKGSGEVNLVLNRGTGSPTFTRATTATTVDSTGSIISVASGVPRSYYDPTTLEYRGYLAEGARTNLLLSSADMRSAAAGNPVTAWTNTDSTVDQDAITSPDGTLTGNLVTEGTAGTASISQAATTTADVAYTTTRFLKYGNCQWHRIIVGSGANTVSAWFDIQNGATGTTAVGGTGSAASASITAFPNGWFRCSLTGTVGSGATSISVLSLSASSNGGGRQNNATRYEWGAQFENNVSFASTYIPTTTASVTRNADVLTYQFAGNADATVGSAYAELSTIWSAPSSSGAHAAISFAPATAPLLDGGTSSSTIRVLDGGATVVTKSGLTAMATGSRKRASAWGSSTMSVTGDGATVASGAFDGDMGSIAVGIGCTTNGAAQWFGTIKNVRIWTSQFSASQLQAITV